MNPVVKDTSNTKVVIGILMLLLTYAAPRKRERLKLLWNSVLLVLLKNRQNWHYLPHESCKWRQRAKIFVKTYFSFNWTTFLKQNCREQTAKLLFKLVIEIFSNKQTFGCTKHYPQKWTSILSKRRFEIGC